MSKIDSLKELFINHKKVLTTNAPITWTPLRDEATATLKGNTVTFNTNVTPLISEYKIRYMKKEILTFDSNEDAERYFYLATEDLNK